MRCWLGGIFSVFRKRLKYTSTAPNTIKMRPPRTHPTIIPNLAADDKEWSCADPVVLLVAVALPVEEASDLDADALSGTSTLR